MYELQGVGKGTSQAEQLINPCVKGMLDTAARTPSHPKWQEEKESYIFISMIYDH